MPETIANANSKNKTEGLCSGARAAKPSQALLQLEDQLGSLLAKMVNLHMPGLPALFG